jgi:ATP-binding cassette subfamily F protein uup
MGGRRFPRNYSDFRAYEDRCSSKEEKQSGEERLETKQPNGKFDFQRAKEYQKIEKRINFRSSKLQSSNYSRTEKYRITTYQKKQKNSKTSIIKLKIEKSAGLS